MSIISENLIKGANNQSFFGGTGHDEAKGCCLMPYNEYRPPEGWIAWQRKQERKEMIKGVLGAFFAFIVYAATATTIYIVEF